MTALHFEDATELARRVRDGECSSLELTDHYIDRIERLDGEVNAVVVRDFERAREAARAADARQAAGESLGPLHGVPFTIKESYNATGLPTTWGFPQLRDNIATEDAHAVARYREAGAVLLGKTNVPIALGDFQSYNEIYGTTGNPWDVTRTPGGSSGGSAAAMVAGFSGFESGSDIGSSIRNPAHFCGVYGHKPTWGIFPPQGQSLPGQVAPTDLAVCGPMARSARDLRQLMDVASGAQPLNARGWRLELPAADKRSLSDYRVAIWATDERAPVSDEVQQRAIATGELLSKLGATVSDVARPDYDITLGHRAYLGLLNSVTGARLPPEARGRLIQIAQEADPDDHSQRVESARGMTLSHADWLASNGVREHMRYAWRDFFGDWDILIAPQMATTAFEHDHAPFGKRTLGVDGEQRPYFDALFWAGIATAPYLPSTVFPTGLAADGLPIGLQAIGAEYTDRLTIDFTRLLAEELGGCVYPDAFA